MTSSLLSAIEDFDVSSLKPTETKETQSEITLETPKSSSSVAGKKNQVLDASSNATHGRRGNSSWESPQMLRYMDVKARPGYNSCKAHEFVDQPEVLRAKVKLLAELIRESKHCVAYTGAGISTSAGIADYATRGGSVPLLLLPMLAKPTIAHRILTSLHGKGHLKHWIQQNHDGLPQKAGYPQHALNEIHGAWFDPSNPVVPMDGELRSDLFQSLLSWEKKADLCLVIGTSLAGMNADRIVQSVSERAMIDEGLGSVIISLQQTPLDDLSTLRIFGEIDEVMEMLAEEMSITPSAVSNRESAVGGNDKSSEGCEEDVFMIPYDDSGKKIPPGIHKNRLDLREGQQVRITSGYYAGDNGVVVGKQLEGHYKIRFMHPIKNKGWLAPKVHVLGRWIIDEGKQGLLDTFPIAAAADDSKDHKDTGEGILYENQHFQVQNKNE